jgi:hypothetical protein
MNQLKIFNNFVSYCGVGCDTVVWWVSTNIMKEHIAYVFFTEGRGSMFLDNGPNVLHYVAS